MANRIAGVLIDDVGEPRCVRTRITSFVACAQQQEKIVLTRRREVAEEGLAKAIEHSISIDRSIYVANVFSAKSPRRKDARKKLENQNILRFASSRLCVEYATSQMAGRMAKPLDEDIAQVV